MANSPFGGNKISQSPQSFDPPRAVRNGNASAVSARQPNGFAPRRGQVWNLEAASWNRHLHPPHTSPDPRNGQSGLREPVGTARVGRASLRRQEESSGSAQRRAPAPCFLPCPQKPTGQKLHPKQSPRCRRKSVLTRYFDSSEVEFIAKTASREKARCLCSGPKPYRSSSREGRKEEDHHAGTLNG